ncbi:MAG TPA: hypothetical protein EYP14_05195, partial [Planctomycetaceae bacterium]|nr:hypothetical protein [Planctomycetaceae bacterium]
MVRRLNTVLVLAVSLALGAFAASFPKPGVFAAERSSSVSAHGPRQVLAFYYPWYGNPNVPGGSGRWAHWSDVDERHKTIGSSTHYPKLGPYDSHDPALVAQHVRWAKQAGVTGFIASWWGHDSFSGRALPVLLKGGKEGGMTVTIYYERVPEPVSPDSAAQDLLRLLRQHGRHPAWLKVGGKPVVFLYGRAIGQLRLEGWEQAIRKVKAQYGDGAVFLGDRPTRDAARVFDGLHTY